MKTVSIPPSDEQLIRRICAEFLEMPCLRLTSRQAQRLFAIGEPSCTRMLDHLVDAGFLARRPDGMYLRLTHGRHELPSTASLAAGGLARTA